LFAVLHPLGHLTLDCISSTFSSESARSRTRANPPRQSAQTILRHPTYYYRPIAARRLSGTLSGDWRGDQDQDQDTWQCHLHQN
jgi:hypothetical protein